MPISTLAQIHPAGLQQPPVIDAAVEEETAIFNGSYGIDHDFGDVVVLDQAAFAAGLAVKQPGNQLGLQFVGAQAIAAITQRGYLVDLAFTNADNRSLRGVIGLFAGLDFDPAGNEPVGAEFRLSLFSLFGVTGMTQVIRHFMGIGFLSDTQAARLGIDLGGIGEYLPAHALIDNLLIFDVVVRKDAEAWQANDKKGR